MPPISEISGVECYPFKSPMAPEEEASLRLEFAKLLSEDGSISPVHASSFMVANANGWQKGKWHPSARLRPYFEYPNRQKFCLAAGDRTFFEEKIITRYSGGSPKGKRRVQARFAVLGDIWNQITESLKNCRSDYTCTNDPEMERLAIRDALFFYGEFLVNTFRESVSQYYVGDYVPDRHGWEGNVLQLGLNTTYNCIDEVQNTIEISRLLYMSGLIPNHTPYNLIEYREEPAYSKYAKERHGVLPILEAGTMKLFGIDTWEREDPQFIPMDEWRGGAATEIIPLWDELRPVFFQIKTYQDELNELLKEKDDLSDFVSDTEYQIDLQKLAITKADVLDYDVFEDIRTEESQLLALPKLRHSWRPKFYVKWYLNMHAVSDAVKKRIGNL